MRAISATSIVFVIATAFALSGDTPVMQAKQDDAKHEDSRQDDSRHDADSNGQGRHDLRQGQAIFRYDTFGDEQLWTNVLRMHEVISTVDPATALAVILDRSSDLRNSFYS